MKAADALRLRGAAVSALLVLAYSPGSIAQGDSVSSGRITISSTEGAQVNLTSTGNSTGQANVTINGNTTTVGTSGSEGGTDTQSVTIPAAPSPPNATGPVGPVTGTEAEGDVRLVSRVDVNGYATGALQIFFDGAWGAVCTAGFDNEDARVACRQLGLTNGVQLPKALFFQATQNQDEVRIPFALENLGCSGNETSLLDCPVQESDSGPRDYRYYDYGSSGTCDPFSDTYALIACGTSDAAAEGDLRLTGGAAAEDGSAEFGRLEVFHSGGWGTVCDNGPRNRFGRSPRFTDGAAEVACKELGYQQGIQIQRLEDDNEALTGRVPIVLAGAACEGAEATLAGCPGVEIGVVGSRCQHEADVHLVCYNGPNAEMDGNLRLSDGKSGTGYEYGRLEMFFRGFWSNICNNDRFTPDSAQVACKALGYGGGAALRFTQSYANSLSQVLFADLPVALAGVDCKGDEASLLECQSNDLLIGQCTNRTSSTVLACANSAPGCAKKPGTGEGAVRLRGGFGTLCDPVYTGFVEVLHFGEWGSICRERFTESNAQDNLVADVVCRQMGFPHGTRIDPLAARPPPPPPDDDEAPSPYGPPYGYYSYYDYNSAAEEAEEPVERFWLSSAECRGPEPRLIDCDLGPGFRSNNGGCGRRSHRLHVACRQFPVVEALEEISTPGAAEGDVRLLNETAVDNWVAGQLQVFFEGSWSQVCAGLFDAADADVACRQLGYGPGTVVPQVLSNDDRLALRTTPLFPEIAITGSGCKGNEASLLDCAADPRSPAFFSRECRNSNGAGLVIGCVASKAAGAEGALRLADRAEGATPGSASGVLEVFHAGAWGSICSGSNFGGRLYYGSNAPAITESTAAIACRELGFESGNFRGIRGDVPVSPPWLSSVQCVGFEPDFADCERSVFGDTSTCRPTLRLFCSSAGDTNGQVRLIGGSAAPSGQWEYGRLEILIDGFWSNIDEGRFGEDLGRRAAQVACRQLGYATGAQLLAGRSSALPVEEPIESGVRQVTCDGSEATLADCDIALASDYGGGFYDYANGIGAVALMCTTPSGCDSPANGSPAEGDVRLVPLNGTAAATQPCDAVHFGGVEIFHDGRWGRICSDRFGPSPQDFTLDAQVVCRQLGFPFGSVMDSEEIFNAYDGQDYDYNDDRALVWATEVVCLGTEDRLLDCDFPEEFEDDRSYGPNFGPPPPRPAPGPGPGPPTPPPPPPPPEGDGIRRASCSRNDNNRFSVICRQFELTESAVIRR